MNLIVAFDNNKAIGKDNKLPWRLKDDLKFFKNLTQNNIVIMGRKTFESIGKPLPNRLNIVLSKNLDFCPENTFTCRSKEEALKICNQYSHLEVFVIGGAQIYDMFKDDVKVIFATKIDTEIQGDTYFDIDFSDFKKDYSICYDKNKNNEHNFEIFKYIKKGYMDFGQYADEVIDNLDDWFYREFYDEYYNDSQQAIFENHQLKIFYNQKLSINEASYRFQEEYFKLMKSSFIIDLDNLTFKCMVKPSFSYVFNVLCELNEGKDVLYGVESELYYKDKFWWGEIKKIER